MHLRKGPSPFMIFFCILFLITRSYSCNFSLRTYYVSHWRYVNGRFTLFSTKTLQREKSHGVLASSAVERGFEPGSGQTKDYTNNICCFSDKHATKTGWLGIGIMCLRGEICTRGLLFQWASTIRVDLVQSGHHYHFFECDLFSPL